MRLPLLQQMFLGRERTAKLFGAPPLLSVFSTLSGLFHPNAHPRHAMIIIFRRPYRKIVDIKLHPDERIELYHPIQRVKDVQPLLCLSIWVCLKLYATVKR